MLNFINSMLAQVDVRLVRKSTHERLISNSDKFLMYEFSELIERKYFINYLENLHDSKSQLGQDLFVLSELGFKRNGFL
jgi:hypothetical protein